MQNRFPGLLFSHLSRNISKSLRLRSLAISLPPYSTESNRPLRGDRSADFFRNLIRDEGNLEKAENKDQNTSTPITGCGERQMNMEHGDFFPDFNNKQPRIGGGGFNRIPVRGEGSEKPRSFQQRLKSDGDGNGEGFNLLRWKEPGGSAGNRGEGKNGGSVKMGDHVKGSDRIGETLFEKLKLGEFCRHGNAHKGSQLPPVAVADSIEPDSPPEVADQIFKKMKETGLIPNAVAMLDGLCKDGLIQEAMKLLRLIREKGTIPEVVVYTAVVEGFCKAARFDDARRIFRKMQDNGIVPNAFSYSVIIQGLCSGKRLEEAIVFCTEMVNASHSPNGATFTGLVDLYTKERGVKEAEDFVRGLREKGFAFDEMAFREHLDKKGPYSSMAWEAIFGRKSSQRPF